VSDRYLEFTHSSFGRTLSSLLGLPQPPRLQRADAAWAPRPLDGRFVLAGATGKSQLAPHLLGALDAAGAGIRILPEHPGLAVLKSAAAALKVTLAGNPGKDAGAAPTQVIVFDASGVASTADLRQVYEFFQPVVGAIRGNGRVLVLTRAPESVEDADARACSAALRGFVRSLGKEIGGKGATANLLEILPGGEDWLAAPLRFFATEHSAYVSGQVLVVGRGPSGGAAPVLSGSLNGKVALVTGAARGIGAAIAQVLAREGARVVGMDRPQEEGALAETMAKIEGVGLPLDVTAADAAQRIAAEVKGKLGGLDVVVHNAGVTRDKMLRNMRPDLWDMVLDINLGAILRINDGLLKDGLNEGGRIVCISSIGGIGGNAGQTNYGASKAGIIGYAEGLAPALAARGGAINAVAPGFIETQMTAAMPVMPREVGRRLSSLSQGGLPQDIAEAVAFLASPAAGGVNGRTLRVCGQNYFGA
jgi:3-oxoacyl-[acyl-carrier protein] reductase